LANGRCCRIIIAEVQSLATVRVDYAVCGYDPLMGERREVLHQQRPPAEVLYADELFRLAAHDRETGAPKPPGWDLSLPSVRSFVVGDSELDVRPKFVGNVGIVDRAMVTLATARGLLLVGEPGTAKSLLSELLAAAISGTSTLVIQGGASLTEDQMKYTWNYALLVSEGPSLKSLVPAPLHQGMTSGRVVRFEEITRCPLEVQDALLSVLSERALAVPELSRDDDGANAMVFASEGFNIIATANTRDRGVNEMSAALRRRFNFETVHPISDFQTELELVKREAGRLLERSGVPKTPSDDLLEVVVTVFRELRTGITTKGQGIEQLSSVLSTAEAVTLTHALGVRAWYLRREEPNAADFVDSLAGTAVKDNADDLKRLRAYLEQRANRKGPVWDLLYNSRHLLGK
jgi:MoxR-like ATPase